MLTAQTARPRSVYVGNPQMGANCTAFAGLWCRECPNTGTTLAVDLR
jgi:hypothetical protein